MIRSILKVNNNNSTTDMNQLLSMLRGIDNRGIGGTEHGDDINIEAVGHRADEQEDVILGEGEY